MSIDIKELTDQIQDIRRLAAVLCDPEPQCTENAPEHPWTIGANYFIRTATYHLTGELVAVHNQELVIDQAAWIADSGRFQQALETGVFNEVEMFPAGRVIVGRGGLIDATEIEKLPLEQK